MTERLNSSPSATTSHEASGEVAGSQPDQRLVVSNGEGSKKVLEEYSTAGARVDLTELALLSRGRALVGVGSDKTPTYLIGRGLIINVPLSLAEGMLKTVDAREALEDGKKKLTATIGSPLIQGEELVSGVIVDTTETKAAPTGEQPTNSDPVSDVAARLRDMPGVQEWIDNQPNPAMQSLFEGHKIPAPK